MCATRKCSRCGVVIDVLQCSNKEREDHLVIVIKWTLCEKCRFTTTTTTATTTTTTTTTATIWYV